VSGIFDWSINESQVKVTSENEPPFCIRVVYLHRLSTHGIDTEEIINTKIET
jgi:hypothetical protein